MFLYYTLLFVIYRKACGKRAQLSVLCLRIALRFKTGPDAALSVNPWFSFTGRASRELDRRLIPEKAATSPCGLWPSKPANYMPGGWCG